METLSKNKIKWIRSLRLKKNREKEQCFIVEGEKMVEEVILQNPDLVQLVCSIEKDFESIETYSVDEKTMKEISSLKTPNKLLAVVNFPNLVTSLNGITLLLDGVQDPGNMGTIIRTADWFGVSTIVCSKETVDCWNSKVIQSSMGSVFRIPILYTDLNEFIKQSDKPVIGTLLEGKNMYDSPLPKEANVIMGNEGNGISSELQKLISHPVLIPGFGGAESLNVAVATGVVLAELKRIQ